MKTAKEMLQEAQKLLGLNQKEFGTYAGVSIRTVNSWMTEDRKVSDHVAEMIYRLAKVDANALEDGNLTTDMMRWAVIESVGLDEIITVCGSKVDALRAAENDWKHLTQAEKKRMETFCVGLIHVQLTEKNSDSRFTYAETDSGWIDTTIYTIAKEYV